MEMKLNEWTEVLIIVVALRSCEIPYVHRSRSTPEGLGDDKHVDATY